MRKEIENYTPTDFVHDLASLGQAFSASGKGDAESTLRYMRQHYSEEQAQYRANLLSLAFQFLIQHREELEAADVLGPGSNMVPTELTRALYRWLVLMPWVEVVPPPPLDVVLRMVRGQE